MSDTPETLAAFAHRASLSMSARNLGLASRADWKGARQWRVTLTSRHGARMGVTYHMGSGHGTTPPDLALVLDCLASDAAGYENARNFADWCGEYGYDTDSRKAERIYRTVGQQAAKLKILLGADYDALLYHTERA